MSTDLPSHRVGFEPDRVDLGELVWDTRVPFTLHFVNRGPASLRIEALEVCCGSLAIDCPCEARRIRSGECSELHSVLSATAKPGLKM